MKTYVSSMQCHKTSYLIISLCETILNQSTCTLYTHVSSLRPVLLQLDRNSRVHFMHHFVCKLPWTWYYILNYMSTLGKIGPPIRNQNVRLSPSSFRINHDPSFVTLEISFVIRYIFILCQISSTCCKLAKSFSCLKWAYYPPNFLEQISPAYFNASLPTI